MSIFGNDKKQLEAAQRGPKPTLPAAPQLPAEYAPAKRRPLSAQAAEAAQRWQDLEDELTHTKSTLEDLRAVHNVLEESNRVLHEDIERLKLTNERLVRENTTIHARLSTAAEIIVGIMKPLQPVIMDEQRLEAAISDPSAKPHSFSTTDLETGNGNGKETEK
jgi:chromosome segregation ATPase